MSSTAVISSEAIRIHASDIARRHSLTEVEAAQLRGTASLVYSERIRAGSLESAAFQAAIAEVDKRAAQWAAGRVSAGSPPFPTGVTLKSGDVVNKLKRGSGVVIEMDEPKPEPPKMCADCGRQVALTIKDVASGMCPREWAPYDSDAHKDCETVARARKADKMAVAKQYLYTAASNLLNKAPADLTVEAAQSTFMKIRREDFNELLKAVEAIDDLAPPPPPF